jgi:anti-anti-sigma regulatory factor
LSALETVNSGLVAALVVLSKRIRSGGGRFILCGMRALVRDVFRRLHLNRALEIADDQQQASGMLRETLISARSSARA